MPLPKLFHGVILLLYKSKDLPMRAEKQKQLNNRIESIATVFLVTGVLLALIFLR